MPPGAEQLTLALILTAAGVTVTAALVTGIVELFKNLVTLDGHERQAAFGVSAVLVILAYLSVTIWAQPPIGIAIETLFAAFLAWYGIARLAIAHYSDVKREPNSLTGPQA